MKQISSARIQASRRGLNLVVLLLLLLNMAGLINLSLIQRLENYTYDLRLQWTMPGSIDRRIVIVDIDEASLHQQGRWPWPRNKVAHLVDLLFDRYKIDVLGFDVLFAERDESSGLASLEALGQTDLRDDKKFATALARLRPRLRYDQTFADCLKDRRVALGYYFRHDFQDKSQVGQLPAPALARGSFDVNAVAA
ncbi:MAG: CHASE2 domain-containing protein, partial [Rhodoferax sp.]